MSFRRKKESCNSGRRYWKQVKISEGEAIGVNLISEKLVDCDDNDYFEKGIELAVNDRVDFSLRIYQAAGVSRLILRKILKKQKRCLDKRRVC